MLGKEAPMLLLTPLKALALASAIYGTSAGEAFAQDRVPESHLGDFMRSRDPQMGNEGLGNFDFRHDDAFDENNGRFQFERQIEQGSGRAFQTWLRRETGIRIPGRLEFNDDVPGDGVRAVLLFPIEPPEP